MDMDMEAAVLKAIRECFETSIKTTLCAYQGPLTKISERVVAKHSDELEAMVDDALTTLIKGEGFKDTLKDVLTQKLARTLIERMSGELESKVNDLKSNPATRAKITLAIQQIVSEM